MGPFLEAGTKPRDELGLRAVRPEREVLAIQGSQDQEMDVSDPTAGSSGDGISTDLQGNADESQGEEGMKSKGINVDLRPTEKLSLIHI